EKNPFHSYEQIGTYPVTLIAVNDLGCSDTLVVDGAAEAQEGGMIIVPNAFTPSLAGPNGGHIDAGGLNDVFYPLSESVLEFNMQIFNRWGELLYVSKEPKIGWDG